MPLRTPAVPRPVEDGPALDGALFAGVVSAAPLPLWVIGPGGEVVIANRAALGFLGYGSNDDLVGGPSHDLLHRCRPDGSEYHAQSCPIVRAQGRSGTSTEWFVTQQGDLRPVSWSTEPVGKDGMTLLHFTSEGPATPPPASQGHRRRTPTQDATVQSRDGMRERALGIIRSRFEDPRFSATALAAEMHLSARSVQALFHDVGSSPAAEIRRVRLDHARAMLEDGHSVRFASHVSGFLDPDTFGRTFRRRFGYAPSRTVRRVLPPAG